MTLILPPGEPANEEEPRLKAREPYNCTMCKHFDRQPHFPNGTGNCLRYPPVIHVIGMQQPKIAGMAPMPVTDQFVPQVGPVFICGEFASPTKDLH